MVTVNNLKEQQLAYLSTCKEHWGGIPLETKTTEWSIQSVEQIQLKEQTEEDLKGGHETHHDVRSEPDGPEGNRVVIDACVVPCEVRGDRNPASH